MLCYPERTGILGQANNAKVQQSHGAVKESISLAYNEYQILKKTADNSKVSSTGITSIQGVETQSLAENEIDTSNFLNFLISKGYVTVAGTEGEGIINVEALTGSKQALGNGTDPEDVYKIKKEGTNYTVTYQESTEATETIYSIASGEEIDWEELFTNAKKPENQTESEDLGIDEDGNMVDMDNWDSSRIEIIEDESGNSSISLSGADYSASGNTIYYPNYTGDINENGEIVGKIPVYVKKVGTEEFLAVTSLEYAFIGRTDLIKAPGIPSSVTNMSYTFRGCTSLTQAPEIPDGVIDMGGTFQGCTSLTQAPEIPDGVIDMGGTFQGCTSLEQAPVISDSVTDMGYTFQGCTSLEQAPVISDSVTDMGYTFYGCTSLEQAPVISDSVTNMYGTFYDCTSLIQAPEIPDSVTLMNGTFYGCTRLEQAPEIPSSVTDLSDIFYGCINLTGNLVINAVPPYPANCRDCLTNAATNDNCNLVLSGNSPYLEEIYATRTEGSHITCPQIDNASTGE